MCKIYLYLFSLTIISYRSINFITIFCKIIVFISYTYACSIQETNFSMETDSITMGIELCKIPHSSEHWP